MGPNRKAMKESRLEKVSRKYDEHRESEWNEKVKTDRAKLSEAQIQASCVMWLWNVHPQTRGLFFSVTNNSEHIARAMQRKAGGLVPGVSDCLFIWSGRLYCFEFKTEIGRQSDAQKEWEAKAVGQGAKYYIVRSLDQFQTLIRLILTNEIPYER